MTKSSTVSRVVIEMDFDRMLALTPTDRAYMAGFFDGEGSIGVYPRGKGGYVTRLVIAQKKPETLLWLHGIIGGALRLVERHDRGNTYYEIAIDDRKHIACVLRVMLPYLRDKKEQADLMLRFIAGDDTNIVELMAAAKQIKEVA